MCDCAFCVDFRSEPTYSCWKDVCFKTIRIAGKKLVPNYVGFQMEHLMLWDLPQPEHQDSPDLQKEEQFRSSLLDFIDYALNMNNK